MRRRDETDWIEDKVADGAAIDLADLARRTGGGGNASAASTRACLRAGHFAPDFTLPDLRGGTISLARLLASGPVVVSFYRGAWSAHCAVELQALAAIQADAACLGAAIVAILPQEPAGLPLVTHALPFAVAVDRGAKIARAYGLVLAPSARNRSNSQILPIPATYVVDRTGRIAVSLIDVDYGNRIEPEQILAALAGLRQPRGD